MAFGLRCKAWLLSVVTSLQAGDANVDHPVLYSVYGTDIVVRLMRIHAHPERDGPNGTLVVALHGGRPAYVQCRFADNGAKLLSEAIVGDYPPKPGQAAPAVPAATEEGLKKAGYWRDAGGRALFPYEITRDSGIWGGASVVILTPLIDVFGARAGSDIDIIAPLAPERDEEAIQRELRRPNGN
ncbi:MAG: hypothetical protein HY543_01530 [Deltaproteobacteria bacterium]|nr:hypothetical protein [Deltaproteobacteria bacterium]